MTATEAGRHPKTLISDIMLFIFQENLDQIASSPVASAAEHIIISAVQWMKLGVETIGAVIIGIGVILSVYKFSVAIAHRQADDYNQVRLTLARYLALALEFQLGADILSTAVAPSWNQLGKLGAIAVIRTGLNYFLMREMELEGTRAGGVEEPEARV
jgi:uncharacterized membrane protein